MRYVAALTLGLSLVVGGFGNPPASTASPSTPAAYIAHPLAAASAEDVVTPVLVSLVGGDTAAVRGSDGRYHVVYELLLMNTATGPATLSSVAVLDGASGNGVYRLDGGEMVAGESLRTLDRDPVASRLAGSQRSARPPANGQFRLSGRRPESADASPRHPEPEPLHNRPCSRSPMSPAPWTCLAAPRPFCRRRLRVRDGSRPTAVAIRRATTATGCSPSTAGSMPGSASQSIGSRLTTRGGWPQATPPISPTGWPMGLQSSRSPAA